MFINIRTIFEFDTFNDSSTNTRILIPHTYDKHNVHIMP